MKKDVLLDNSNISLLKPEIRIKINSNLTAKEVYVLIFFPMMCRGAIIKQKMFGNWFRLYLHPYVELLKQLSFINIAIINGNGYEYEKCKIMIDHSKELVTYDIKGNKIK